MRRWRRRLQLDLWALREWLRIPAPGESFRAARRRRADWMARVRAAQLHRLGMSEPQLRKKIVGIGEEWCGHGPWRFLPRPIAERAFQLFGGRFVRNSLHAAGSS